MPVSRAQVIIPAYNEGGRIEAVIEAATTADPKYISTDNIIVVDNSSDDDTALVAEACGAHVIECLERGKGYAMGTGVNLARNLGAGSLLFLDADLRGLTGEAVTRLAEPVVSGEALMNIGFLGGRQPVSKRVLRKWGGFSGQRAVSWQVWDALGPSDLRGWRIEAAMNTACRNAGLGAKIARTELEGVRHVGKRDKEASNAAALISYGRTYLSALRGLLSRASIVE